jgi:DNA repair photolyase
VFRLKKGTRYMNKNEKEPKQISTTDKLKALKALKEAGLRVELSGSGVPTVVCVSPLDIDKEIKNVRKILQGLRYNGSFGVRGPRKTDQISGEDVTEKKEEGEAIPA